MGDFNKENTPLKRQARIGQIFSGTKFIHELTNEEMEKIDDIKRGDSVFTDGCGNISPNLAGMIDN